MGLLTRKPPGLVPADPDPGIGGYITPRGPAGETGYPGSTSATRENPEPDTRLQPPIFPQELFGRRVLRRPALTIPEQQADVIPYPAEHGGLPFHGPNSKTNPQGPGMNSVRDTEVREHIIVGGDTGEGSDEGRNAAHYYGGVKAKPGQLHTYKAAGQGRHFPITDVTVPNRYFLDGSDQLSDQLQSREMPYTGHRDFRGNLGHARGSRRGAVLDGARFYQYPDTELNQGGAFGIIRTSQRHRPTVFQEPAPWSAAFYDTNTEIGTPDQPGRNDQVVQATHISPVVGRRSTRRHRG